MKNNNKALKSLAAKKAGRAGSGDLGSERTVMRRVDQTNRTFRSKMKEDPENAFGLYGFSYRDKGGKLQYGSVNARSGNLRTSRPMPRRNNG